MSCTESPFLQSRPTALPTLAPFFPCNAHRVNVKIPKSTGVMVTSCPPPSPHLFFHHGMTMGGGVRNEKKVPRKLLLFKQRNLPFSRVMEQVCSASLLTGVVYVAPVHAPSAFVWRGLQLRSGGSHPLAGWRHTASWRCAKGRAGSGRRRPPSLPLCLSRSPCATACNYWTVGYAARADIRPVTLAAPGGRPEKLYIRGSEASAEKRHQEWNQWLYNNKTHQPIKL